MPRGGQGAGISAQQIPPPHASRAELKAAAAGKPLSNREVVQARLKEKDAQRAAAERASAASTSRGRGRHGRSGRASSRGRSIGTALGGETGGTVGGVVGGGAGMVASAGSVVTLASILLVLATWDGFSKPLFISMWTATEFRPTYSWNLMVGGIVFIIIMGVIASQSPNAGGVMLLSVIAMWIVFLMFNGQPTISAFFDWFTQNPQLGKVSAAGAASSKSSQVSMKVPNPSAPQGQSQPTTLM
jgi:hypothetical protein